MTARSLPPRRGPRPRTTSRNPHMQLDQQPEDASVREELARRVFAFPHVAERPSQISLPGARALVLPPPFAAGPPEAFMVDGEFAHLHPTPDMSLHIVLPPDVAEAAVAAGWAEPHPVARLGYIPPTTVMVYAPRDRDELEVVAELLRAAYDFARGA